MTVNIDTVLYEMFFVLKITNACVVQTFEDMLFCFLVLETYRKRYLQNDMFPFGSVMLKCFCFTACLPLWV